jgi:Fe2+ or Zn2+ uptake regulation protein
MARSSRISAAILQLMGLGGRHAWTLDDLHAGLREGDSGPDFSSVFRSAEKLAGEGSIRKLLLEDGRARFELAAAHHDHLHCTRCGELVPVSCVLDSAAFAAVEAATGVAITEHSVVFSGLCQGCNTAAEAERCV